jgi:hypothetical protein
LKPLRCADNSGLRRGFFVFGYRHDFGMTYGNVEVRFDVNAAR